MEFEGPNAEQIQYWNETVGPKWVRFHERIDAQVEPLGIEVMDRSGIGPGERVLDVGCGCGQTTLHLARRVGSAGAATGIDVSALMLERATHLATAAGVANARFEQADAQTHSFPSEAFDAVYSRFGLMFFADTEAAFVNLRAALRPKGRIGFACWRQMKENPWMLLPLMAAAEFVPLPPPPAPGAPGPFALADPVRVRTLLERAGFVDVEFEVLDREVAVGGGTNLDATVEFVLQMGPTGAALREAGEELRPQVQKAVREALATYVTPKGVCMQAAAWIVTGRKE